jgi:hypothetical protein
VCDEIVGEDKEVQRKVVDIEWLIGEGHDASCERERERERERGRWVLCFPFFHEG